MKKMLLLAVLLPATTHSAYAQFQGLPQLSWQTNEPARIFRAEDRSEFPTLLVDSVHCESFDYESPYSLTNESFYTYEYDSQERLINDKYRSNDLPEIGDWHHTTYTHDAQGRVVESITVVETAPGNFLNAEKEETTFAPDGTSSESLSYYWDISIWVLAWRNLKSFDSQGRVIQELNQQWDGSGWSNQYQYTYSFDANGNQTLYRTEGWDAGTNAWYINYESVRVFDNDGKLLSTTTGFGSIFTPFQPSYKYEYHYDAQGRNDYTDEYDWDEILSQWVAVAKDAHTYNAQNELEQTLHYDIVNQVSTVSGRTLYAYGEGVYTDQPELRTYQILDQGSFKDEERFTSDFSDLPGGQVGYLFETANQIPPGSGDWIRRFDCNVIYHISTVSSTGQSETPAPCVAPNPYTPGTQVVCPGLHDNYSYMLWVYSLDGRVGYARQFNGSEGWSVDKQLPQGAYLVVVTHNGRQVSAQKVVFE